MDMGHEDACDTGLSLRLGYEGRRRSSTLPATDGKQKQDTRMKFDPWYPNSTVGIEPSLTLGLSDDTRRLTVVKTTNVMDKAAGEEPTVGGWRQSSPHSTVSSFSNPFTGSIKREKDMGSEDVEVERVSSRISDDEEDGNARKKLRLTKDQSALLEDRFKEHSTLNPKQKQALAKQLKLMPRQVEVWFQNRRARTKVKQTEVDCEFLKRCCETLTDENRRLQKEVQELKALKFSPQLYMQLPAATLTMCPSCERIGGATDGSKGGGGGGQFIRAQKPHLFNPFTHSSSAAC